MAEQEATSCIEYYCTRMCCNKKRKDDASMNYQKSEKVKVTESL